MQQRVWATLVLFSSIAVLVATASVAAAMTAEEAQAAQNECADINFGGPEMCQQAQSYFSNRIQSLLKTTFAGQTRADDAVRELRGIAEDPKQWVNVQTQAASAADSIEEWSGHGTKGAVRTSRLGSNVRSLRDR